MFEDLNGVWLLTAGGMLFGFLGVILRYAYKTKCEHINICWGLVKIHRDIQTEATIERAQIENGIDPEADLSNTNHSTVVNDSSTSLSSLTDVNAAGGKKISSKSDMSPTDSTK
jgi:hypothetical protein